MLLLEASLAPAPPSNLWNWGDATISLNDPTYLMDGTRTGIVPPPPPPPPPPSTLWKWNDATILLNDPTYFMDGTHLQRNTAHSLTVDIYDELNGSIDLAWSALGSKIADSYNVYVDGVFNQNVVGLRCTITGLQKASYDIATQTITPSLNYTIRVVAVIAGVEAVASLDKGVTPNPSSVMLVTPMKRVYPYPDSGLE